MQDGTDTGGTDTGGSTVIVLPETEADTLCVRFTGLIRREDHRRTLYTRLEALMEAYGSYNLLIEYGPDYIGWEQDAADISLRSIMAFGPHARRIAYVNPTEKKILQTKLTASLFSGEIRLFEKDEYPQAVVWVRGAG